VVIRDDYVNLARVGKGYSLVGRDARVAGYKQADALLYQACQRGLVNAM